MLPSANLLTNHSLAHLFVYSLGVSLTFIIAGVPVAAARKLLQGKAALIGQLVTDPAGAAAAAADGANFVLMEVG